MVRNDRRATPRPLLKERPGAAPETESLLRDMRRLVLEGDALARCGATDAELDAVRSELERLKRRLTFAVKRQVADRSRGVS